MSTSGVLLMSVALAPFIANADGGAICLSKISGPFLVTVFVSPEPIRAGPIDTSILVQDRRTGGVILDAMVNLAIEPLSGKRPGILTRATSEQARNKLLKAARIDLPDTGWWVLTVVVRRGREEAVLTTSLDAAPPMPRVARLWPFLLFPPFAIALFALHQALRPRRAKPAGCGACAVVD
jgi:hypothetical protein